MQYHGNKTLNQRVFKGIECNTMETWKGIECKTLNQRVFKGIECNIMETRL